jgi:hypothetical protein
MEILKTSAGCPEQGRAVEARVKAMSNTILIHFGPALFLDFM